jgi:phosphatidylglycerophosphate synthase
MFSLLAGLAAAIGIVSEHFVVAALLIQLHHLLDGADGNLARYRRQCSDFGRCLDVATDQVVRFAILVALAWVAEVPLWLKVSMIATVYIDTMLVTLVISPYASRHPLRRHAWKRWFMNRGLMPGFDIFTLYLVISICLLFQSPEASVALVAILKTIDWVYRLYECAATAMFGSDEDNHHRNQHTIG